MGPENAPGGVDFRWGGALRVVNELFARILRKEIVAKNWQTFDTVLEVDSSTSKCLVCGVI